MGQVWISVAALVGLFSILTVLTIFTVTVRMRRMKRRLLGLAKHMQLSRVLGRGPKHLPFYAGEHHGCAFVVTEIVHKTETDVSDGRGMRSEPYTRVMMGCQTGSGLNFQLRRSHMQTALKQSFDDNFPLSKSMDGLPSKTQEPLMLSLGPKSSLAIRLQRRSAYQRVHLPADVLLSRASMVLMFDIPSKTCTASHLEQRLNQMKAILDTLE
jgi:hypothetical protein